MLLFGRSLLGGALVAGYVSVSGAAVCSASATGEAQVLYKGAGVASAHVHASGDSVRTAIAAGTEARATAEGTSAPVAFYYGEGTAQVSALVQGSAQASFYGSGLADAVANAYGKPYRRIRMPFQPPAKAYAYAEGDGVNYTLVYGKAAIARARLIGTTHYVGNGRAQAIATLYGDAQKVIGQRQVATANATAYGVQVYIAGAGGTARAEASAKADADVTRNGVRRVELLGRAEAKAEVSLSQILIFQPQVMRATASAYGAAVQARGFEGKALATATATGYMDMTYTGQEGDPARVTATATGYGVRLVYGAGVAIADATGIGNASALFNGTGNAIADSLISVGTVHIQLTNQPSANANASAEGDALKTLVAEPVVASATAEAFGYNQINDLVKAPEGRTVVIGGDARLYLVEAEPRLITVGA